MHLSHDDFILLNYAAILESHARYTGLKSQETTPGTCRSRVVPNQSKNNARG